MTPIVLGRTVEIFLMTDDTPKKANKTTDNQDRGWHEEQGLEVFMYRLGDKRKNRE